MAEKAPTLGLIDVVVSFSLIAHGRAMRDGDHDS